MKLFSPNEKGNREAKKEETLHSHNESTIKGSTVIEKVFNKSSRNTPFSYPEV